MSNSDEDYRRSTCDHLLEVAREADNDDADPGSPTDPDGILGHIEDHEEQDVIAVSSLRSQQRRAFFIRTVALLCACSLSVGSHYATNILGPLKSRLKRELGTSHTEFGLLLSAYSLNSTWTPLVGGILASRLGTTYTSILATGVILLGQIFLLFGDIWADIRLMTLGLFIFGLGVSPLAVVQETIIVRFFKSHGLGISMAFGLIAGKGASFLSARTSYPLTERFGSRAPFYVSTTLAAISVVINLAYISLSKWLIDGAGAELEAPDISEEAKRRLATNLTEAQALEKVAEKRKVHIRQIAKLGDVFWV
ncbi:Major facilitator superfamily domain-containing protein 1 [Psilocybe cubensis]|uniref:Lysosomal dipeptide transporter MFSD1 n=2 Tax=Psilocybe cubensis TaxID=181762 RepID=A0A8H8CPT7_PSICU|nr:Major facilitator superfamily domain-containing protein 1 [Psilocybe cubensis]KAH9486909.1 Major facilitator superfamily domain-containing protein 1 [Psilocybe cubensis]